MVVLGREVDSIRTFGCLLFHQGGKAAHVADLVRMDASEAGELYAFEFFDGLAEPPIQAGFIALDAVELIASYAHRSAQVNGSLFDGFRKGSVLLRDRVWILSDCNHIRPPLVHFDGRKGSRLDLGDPGKPPRQGNDAIDNYFLHHCGWLVVASDCYGMLFKLDWVLACEEGRF